MWYEKEKEGIDFDLPIFAETTSGGKETYILMPQIGENSKYTIIGYNWFRLGDGKYNSCSFFKTAKRAIGAYSGHRIFNGDIVVRQKQI